MAVLPAAQSGSHRKTLEALRDELAAAFDAADVNIKPQMSGQLRAVLADLAALPSSVGKVPVKDELKARRKDRVAAAKAGASAAGSGQ